MFSSIELAHVYNLNKVGLKNFERLVEEHGILSIAGHSHTLNDSVKIVWYNQTRVLRLFTHINDETLVTKYVETIIRIGIVLLPNLPKERAFSLQSFC